MEKPRTAWKSSGAHLLSGFITLWLAGASLAKVLGNPENLDALLRELSATIGEEIDVVAGETAKWKLAGQNSGPRVARLTGMPKNFAGKDGSWSVHEPRYSGGGTAFGKRVGTVPEPPSVDISSCSCR